MRCLAAVYPACIGLCALCAGGCATPQKNAPIAAQVSPTANATRASASANAPFPHTSLKVRNACFVESVHFYDEYFADKRGGNHPWARVLQWGNDSGTIQKIGLGHAVALCRIGAVLWMFDINYGFVPLLAPVEKCDDITEIGPEIFAKYPQFKPIFVSYREDLMPSRPDNIPQYISNSGNADIRDATKVASELGHYRVVRVIGFTYTDSGSGQVRTGAAALFAFGQRLCIYFPSRGTHLSRLYAGSFDDLVSAARIVREVYPTATGVYWQKGGAWKQPRDSIIASSGTSTLAAAPVPLINVDVRLRWWGASFLSNAAQ